MRMPLAEGDPGWWGWAEKDAWFDFKQRHPEQAEVISTFVLRAGDWREISTDPVMSSGVQYEGLCLRVAELVGLEPEHERVPIVFG